MGIRKTLRKWINKPETSQQNDYSFAPTAKPAQSSPASIESTPEKLATASSVDIKPPSSSVSHSDVGSTDIPPKDLDLWTLAYDKLEQRDQELMHMYKQCLGLSLQDTSIADLSSSKSVSLSNAADALRAILHQTFMQNRTSNAIKTAVSDYDDFKDSYLSSFPKL
ncbi:hypothetical protein N7467_009965 [Penicillium canescens]|nr:hypothetical protein N7467_009965 [Penicillium canescens]